jgi:hypothetical protein
VRKNLLFVLKAYKNDNNYLQFCRYLKEKRAKNAAKSDLLETIECTKSDFLGRRMRAEDGGPLLALFPKKRGSEAKISFSTRK